MNNGMKIVAVILFLLALQLGFFLYSTQHKYASKRSTQVLAIDENNKISSRNFGEFVSRMTSKSPPQRGQARVEDTNSINRKNHSSVLCNRNRLRWFSSPETSSNSSALRNWRKGTFCDNFFTKTFQLELPMCSNTSCLRESVECYGNPFSYSMGTCVLRNIAVAPDILAQVMYDADRPRFEQNMHSVAFLNGMDTECVNMSTDKLSTRVESGDYVFKVIKAIKEEKTRSPVVCDVWINETTFFFTAHRFHIFFRFLDYFNVHKLVEDLKHTIPPGARIVRISGSDNYHFPDFDQALFPEMRVHSLDELKDAKTCFKEVVLVPKSYASTIFQCKNHMSLMSKCSKCDGKGLNETDISKFSNRVLKACSSRNKLPEKDKKKLLVLVSRRPYLRNQNDKLDRFERVLDNEAELKRALREAFENTTIKVLRLENMGICDQIAYGHNADVFVGVHGSGLVHLWWMRDKTLLYEMEPHYQVGNPTFRVLSYLSGHNYHSDFATGGYHTVHSDVNGVVENIKKHAIL